MQPCNRIYYWNYKFYYKVASCWLFLLSHTTMHGSVNIKSSNFLFFGFCPISELQCFAMFREWALVPESLKAPPPPKKRGCHFSKLFTTVTAL